MIRKYRRSELATVTQKALDAKDLTTKLHYLNQMEEMKNNLVPSIGDILKCRDYYGDTQEVKVIQATLSECFTEDTDIFREVRHFKCNSKGKWLQVNVDNEEENMELLLIW